MLVILLGISSKRFVSQDAFCLLHSVAALRTVPSKINICPGFVNLDLAIKKTFLDHGDRDFSRYRAYICCCYLHEIHREHNVT